MIDNMRITSDTQLTLLSQVEALRTAINVAHIPNADQREFIEEKLLAAIKAVKSAEVLEAVA